MDERELSSRLAEIKKQTSREFVQLWENGPYWSVCNLGGNKPQDSGLFYCWGDIVGYMKGGGLLGRKWVTTDHLERGFKFNSDMNELMPFNKSMLLQRGWATERVGTREYNLTSARDAATVLWGEAWRTPQYEEFYKLVNDCDWTEQTVMGVRGTRISGRAKFSGKSIFLPASGQAVGTSSHKYVGEDGYYWASTGHDGDGVYQPPSFFYRSGYNHGGAALHFSYDGWEGKPGVSRGAYYAYRNIGFVIRPVLNLPSEADERQKIKKAAQQEQLRREREERWLSCLFSAAAKLAKADGIVDESEVRVVEQLFTRYSIPVTKRDQYRKVFNQAIQRPSGIYADADFIANNTTEPEACVFFYELLWDIACADGILTPEEKEILRVICQNLKLPSSYFDINYRRREETFTEGPKRRTYRRSYSEDTVSPSLNRAYAILGCNPNATDDEARSAYRKSAKAYHPDILRANNVPEDLIVIANEKMVRLNEAWALIRKARGI